MYRTPAGDRFLQGAEANLFAAALGQTLFWLKELPDEEWGINAYDRLTLGQKLTALVTVGEALLSPTIEPFHLTQWMDATVATVFEVLHSDVVPEIDCIGQEDELPIRFTPLVEARAHEAGFTCPERVKEAIPEWQSLIDCMSEEILFDLDYADEDLYVDQEPAVTEALLRRMAIHPAYFSAVVDDPPDDALGELFKRLERLTAHAWPG